MSECVFKFRGCINVDNPTTKMDGFRIEKRGKCSKENCPMKEYKGEEVLE